MTCSACSARVQRTVEKVPGVTKCDVNLLTNSMTVEGDFSDGAIEKAVKKAGYGAKAFSDRKEETSSSKRTRLLLSFLFLVPLFFLSMGPMIGLPFDAWIGIPWLYVTLQCLLVVPILILNFSFFTNGFSSLFKGAPNMNTLIALGSSVAFLYSLYIYGVIVYYTALGAENAAIGEHIHGIYFESAGMIPTLVSLGKYLESLSKGRTTSAIEKLLNLSPDVVTVVRDRQEFSVRTDDVSLGEIVVAKAGERIALDGIVTSGNASVDTSAVTGESLPREVETGSAVVSGTMVLDGCLTYETTAVGEDTTIKKIARFVEDAASSKAPVGRLADKISGIFVPVVMAIAIVVFVVWMIVKRDLPFALNVAVSVLVISCPCALGLATPVAIMVGTGKAAEKGILFKNAESLEKIHLVNRVVLDKTGTVTEGKPTVSAIVGEKTLAYAYALEKLSSHPLAGAICAAAEEKHLPLYAVVDFAEIAGRGLKGTIEGKIVLVGNERLLVESGIEPCARGAGTAVYVAEEDFCVGRIDLSDRPKEDSAEAVKRLNAMGVDAILLTGDNESAAQEICREVGIERYVAEVYPEDKAEYVGSFRREGKTVAMVGDGINDAPALSIADVGIAIGAGTDIAVESADVVLLKNSLSDVPEAIDVGRQTMKIIKQNLFWAFGYNVLGIPIAAGALYPAFGLLLNPMIAAACMSISSLTVVTNALRLRRIRSHIEHTKKTDRKRTKSPS